MRLVLPGAQGHWSAFWGCLQYPLCLGTREIMPDGQPESDYDETETFIREVWYAET